MKIIKVPAGKTLELVLTPLSDIKVVLGEDSRLTVISIQDAPVTTKLKRSSKLGKGASLKWVDYWMRGSVDLTSEDNLDGMNASVKRVGIFVGSINENFYSNIRVNHNAPKTISNISAKGILAGKSRAKTLDTISVKKGSKNSLAKQKTDILLLDKEAFADAAPQLEIEEEQVSCSHGVAIGRINPEKLFYLMSRGLAEKEAKRQIIEAFFEPAFAGIRDEDAVCALKNKVLAVVKKW